MYTIRCQQHAFTERNITKYCSVNFVWGKNLHRYANLDKDSKGEKEKYEFADGNTSILRRSSSHGLNLPKDEKSISKNSQPLIFAVVPHGVAPLGVTAYPMWSKLFNSNLCRWTAAPVVLKIPIIGTWVKGVGYIAASAESIEQTLMSEKKQNVGIILDGIAGMFQTKTTKRRNNNDLSGDAPKEKIEEYAYLNNRKGIVKIALRTGTPIVPVYGFGHNQMWNIKVDPFGILKAISLKLNTSVVPFFGRPWGMWFIGPPFRVPVTIALGDPVLIPKTPDNEITQELVDKYHKAMVDGYVDVFEKHKCAYYGDEEGKRRFLKIV